MTPEQAARFVLSDGRDPDVRAIADREADAAFADAMRDPEFRARFDQHVRAFADDIDRAIVERVYGLTVRPVGSEDRDSN